MTRTSRLIPNSSSASAAGRMTSRSVALPITIPTVGMGAQVIWEHAWVTVPGDRPLVEVDHHTEDLPELPQRDRTIPAERWVEAPPELLGLGADIGAPVVLYKRRIGGWLLWRSGPPNKGDTRYMDLAAPDPGRQFTFRLYPDGTGTGEGPDGAVHTRFRTWKEALRDTPPA